MNQIVLISILVCSSGLVGGVGNFFRSEENMENWRFRLGRSVLLGIIAAFTVPLFLNMVSSDLLQFGNGITDYFVFIGFCLIAAFFSNRFMNSVGDKILHDLEQVKRKTDIIEEETKENAEKVEVLVEDRTDGGTVGSVDPNLQALENEMPKELVTKIFQSFNNDKFKFRTVGGIARDSGLDSDKAKELIEKLENKQIVKRYRGRGGKTIYSLTQD